jgi:hypothetical protein
LFFFSGAEEILSGKARPKAAANFSGAIKIKSCFYCKFYRGAVSYLGGLKITEMGLLGDVAEAPLFLIWILRRQLYQVMQSRLDIFGKVLFYYY